MRAIHCQKVTITLVQRRWGDNKNKVCAFEGGGPWGQRGKLSQKRCILWETFYCREILSLRWLLLVSRWKSWGTNVLRTNVFTTIFRGCASADCAAPTSAGKETQHTADQSHHLQHSCTVATHKTSVQAHFVEMPFCSGAWSQGSRTSPEFFRSQESKIDPMHFKRGSNSGLFFSQA